jgi:hypothetical protein
MNEERFISERYMRNTSVQGDKTLTLQSREMFDEI